MVRRIQDQHGYTLAELLVALLIVAILVAIALPSFIAQRSRAQDAEAKAAVTAAAQALVIWHQDQGTYAGAGRADLGAIEPSLLGAVNLTIAGTGSTYRIAADSKAGPNGGGTFRLEFDGAETTRTCDNAGRGGCRRDGEW